MKPKVITTDWPLRWLVLPSWRRLHRVASVTFVDGQPAGVGYTVCGLRGRLAIPGVFSRLGLPRCAHCCRMVGIPAGNGAPFNKFKLRKWKES